MIQNNFFNIVVKTFSPDDDGITHINIYSKSKTELGRILSNFAHTPFTTVNHGKFASVEGFYYWLKSGMQYDELRNLHGFQAKSVGRKFPIVKNENFDLICKQVIRYKLMQNRQVYDLLKASSLPFTHYYSYSGKIVQADNKWADWWEELRDKIKLGVL